MGDNIFNISFQNIVYICLALLFVLVGLCIVLICLLSNNIKKTKLMKKQLDELGEDESITEAILKQMKVQENAIAKTDDLAEKVELLDGNVRKTFDKIAVVRYSASSDNISEPSFSVGITNADDDGIVITGIQDVGGTRVTVKTVNGGKCAERLTREEKKTLER